MVWLRQHRVPHAQGPVCYVPVSCSGPLQELAESLRTLGMKATDKEIWDMIATVDDGDGLLQFSEFVHLMASSRHQVNGSVMGQLSEMREVHATLRCGNGCHQGV